ncbi:MAG: 1-deoxy-D-xylulose-5-phosphate reductoisomerase [Nanoarchaeota archaeon]|nr:1-deoxy-D-xylulose-5-phosphate reductoisomerase [Nanoarchaeota archaeon]
MKSISILGSTGSIGVQTLDVIKSNSSEFRVAGLSCGKNIDLLREQIAAYSPEVVAVADGEAADRLIDSLKADIDVLKGALGVTKIALLDSADTVVNSLVGSSGVVPTLRAINAGKNIALANKETLVVAGSLVMDAVKRKGVTLMPIDSEHSAIFQCLNGEKMDAVSKITLTCSGGPFKDRSLEELKTVSLSDALAHPTWKMGDKITIDSSTLMNKGFEVIETHWLYGVGYDQIEVVIHPQSIVHSLVEFKDRSVMAQLGVADMRIPIQYALSHPSRIKNDSLNGLDLVKQKELTFSAPDLSRFPCLGYAYWAGKLGGSMPCVLNAANEKAVAAFLEGGISYLEIGSRVKAAMDAHTLIKNPTVDELLDIDSKIKKADSDL